MRKTSLALLCVALCLTMILPVSAKRGGRGQSPTMVSIAEDILYSSDPTGPGPVKYHNTKRSFGVTVGVEGKKQPRYDITFSTDWPDPDFSGQTYESYKTFITIYGYKDESKVARVTISHETETENYVMWCMGEWSGDLIDTIEISINEVTTSDGVIHPVQLYFVITIVSS